MTDQPACECLWSKIDEQVERTDHLIAMLPEGAADFVPPIPGAWTTGLLLGHLLDCLAGICAVLHASHPQRLQHFEQLRELPVNQPCGKDQARARISEYRLRIQEGFGWLSDADLSRRLPTVFTPDGESILTLLLGNLEHVINHKHQLFTNLKMMGVEVGSADLYRFRA